jgi:hypothetical protein
MSRTHLHRACTVAALLLAVPCLADAQQPPAPAASSGSSQGIPRPDELEPGVNTTAIETAPTASSPVAPANPSQPVAAASAAAGPSKTAPARQDPAMAKDATAEKGASTAKDAATAKTASRKGPDRLELDATDITGNRELPKVLYIVPWKRSDLGDVVGRPVNSLLDEVLQPLDRDVFQRENRYYDALKPGAGDAKAGAAQGSQTKP